VSFELSKQRGTGHRRGVRGRRGEGDDHEGSHSHPRVFLFPALDGSILNEHRRVLGVVTPDAHEEKSDDGDVTKGRAGQGAGEGGRKGSRGRSPRPSNVEEEQPSDGGVLELVMFLSLWSKRVRGRRGRKGWTHS
jgi:hypothetical protein